MKESMAKRQIKKIIDNKISDSSFWSSLSRIPCIPTVAVTRLMEISVDMIKITPKSLTARKNINLVKLNIMFNVMHAKRVCFYFHR